jgi:hypothetical protein
MLTISVKSKIAAMLAVIAVTPIAVAQTSQPNAPQTQRQVVGKLLPKGIAQFAGTVRSYDKQSGLVSVSLDDGRQIVLPISAVGVGGGDIKAGIKFYFKLDCGNYPNCSLEIRASW